MHAMVLTDTAPIEQRPLQLTAMPDPSPVANQVRVHVEACAICRTDLHVIEGELPSRNLPIIPGHQIVGLIDMAGEAVTRREIGERVGIAWLRHTCGSCDFCKNGQENLCPASLYTGYHEHGGYAEFAMVDEDFCYPLSGLSAVRAAPLLCAGIIGYRALKRSNFRPGERLGIFGFGSSAHITIQIARALGAEVFVATRDERHMQLASELGAVWAGSVIDAFPTKVHRAIIFAPDGTLIPRALECLARGGTLALAGIFMTPVPTLDYERHLFHEKEIRSVECNTREDGKELFERWSGFIEPVVTQFPLEQANEALLALKTDGLNGTGVLVTDFGATCP